MRLLLAAIALLTLISGVQTWRVSPLANQARSVYATLVKERADAEASTQPQTKPIVSSNTLTAKLKDIGNEAQAQIDKAQLDADSARKSSKRLLDAFANTAPCAKPPKVQPLPPQAKRPVPPTICVPTCSEGFSKLQQTLVDMLTKTK